ncbi:MAG: DUF4445 domain-containing protein [Clostridia bacterium]|nr:DUF4445 domain-containing protein [Clostridia bacterium]
MNRITINNERKVNLLSLLLESNAYINSPCMGTGVCGKCRVKTLSGEYSPVCDAEKAFLTDVEIAEGWRLACMTDAFSDVDVLIPDSEKAHPILSSGHLPDFEHEYREGYGAAIDIGTTTVVCSVVNLTNGEIIASASDINAQKIYGLDVLTRITYEYEQGEKAITDLRHAIVTSLDNMLNSLCSSHNIDKNAVRTIMVSANCTMAHMLLGVDARSLGKSPYKPVFLDEQTVKASCLGFGFDNADLVTLPQVSAYIGADIVAGAFVTDLKNEKGNVLFIDIGTNGEIILAKNGTLLSCSCAAGPALEGMNISCGMRAAEGAVEDIEITPDGVKLAVIGNISPKGLCGSGILAAVRELVKHGFVKKSGVFIKPESLDEGDWRRDILKLDGKKRYADLGDGIIITQDDIRQVQLAKGAILSGFNVLLSKAGITADDLDKVIIAGQFGSHLPVSSLIGIGLLPESVENKLIYVGNSSLSGAYMALMSGKIQAEMSDLARHIDYFELAETENYELIFASSMAF